MIPHRSLRRTAVPFTAALLTALFAPTAAQAAEPVQADVAPLVGLGAENAAVLLAELVVADESTLEAPIGAFGPWVDADGDGCDTRAEVLFAESLVDVTVGPNCSVVSGSWESAWDGLVVRDGPSATIEHAVPLGEAWASGAHAWTEQDRSDFHNDLELEEALVAMSPLVGRDRIEQDPSTWLPPVEAARCDYVTDWIAVKWLWDLSVDPAERDALAAALEGCPPWPLYKLPYAGTIYELVTNDDGTSTPVPISFERWRDVYGFADYGPSPTEIVRYPWSSTLYAVTTWPGDESDWTVQRLTFAQWQLAGFPAPADIDWIPGSTLHRYPTATQIFLVSPAGGVPHKLTFAEWQATGFAPYEQRTNEGFVKLSWDTGILHMTDLAAGVGAKITFATWAQHGFPNPQIVDRLAGDSVYRSFGSRTVWYSGPTLSRPITFAEWQRMGFPAPEVRDVPSQADKDCGDYPSQAAAQRDYLLWLGEGYGDVFDLDGDGDGVACESYFG